MHNVHPLCSRAGIKLGERRKGNCWRREGILDWVCGASILWLLAAAPVNRINKRAEAAGVAAALSAAAAAAVAVAAALSAAAATAVTAVAVEAALSAAAVAAAAVVAAVSSRNNTSKGSSSRSLNL